MDPKAKRLQKRFQVYIVVKTGCAIHERKTMSKQQKDTDSKSLFQEFVRKANVATISEQLRCNVPVASQWDLIVKKTLSLATKGDAVSLYIYENT